MIDFTQLPHKQKCYAGANGSKLSVIYNGEQYMLKFPPIPSRNKDMSYTNGCASEYIGCHIFEIIGIPVQETVLGTYTVGNKEKVVVACKDFKEDSSMVKLCDNIQKIYESEIKKGNIISMLYHHDKSDGFRATLCVFMKYVLDDYRYNEVHVEKNEQRLMHYPYEKYYICRDCGCLITGPLQNDQRDRYEANPFEKASTRIVATPENVYWLDDDWHDSGVLPVWKDSGECFDNETVRYLNDLYVNIPGTDLQILVKEWSSFMGAGSDIYYMIPGREKPFRIGGIHTDINFHPFATGRYSLSFKDRELTVLCPFQESDTSFTLEKRFFLGYK